MKLKKIASLMLAGVMAVSMLAGCNTANDNGDDTNVPEIPASTTVSDYANDALDELEGKLEFAGSSWLDAKMTDLATNSSKFTANDIENRYNSNTLDGHQTMSEELMKALLGEGVTFVDYTAFATARGTVGSASWATVYTVSGKMDMESAVQSVVAYLDGVLSNSLADTVVLNGSTYDCDYNGEISAVKVTNSSISGKSAWVVSVVIEQNVTKAANVQV